MAARHRSSWQRTKQHPVRSAAIVVTIGLMIALLAVIILGYQFKWAWTGFNEEIGPKVQQYQPAKTLFDWLGLLGVLAVPIVEAALQAYINNMSEFLLHENLRESQPEYEGRTIARIQTLLAFRRLDSQRKRIILEFLYSSGLIFKDKAIIALRGADLSGIDLTRAHLSGADLSGVNLSGADLYGADFGSNADLTGVNLSEADLSAANLTRVCLNGANLHRANLTRANLYKADLRETDLSTANLSYSNLNGAGLEQANLYDADLGDADLQFAILTGANMYCTRLYGANLYFSSINDASNTTAEQLGHARSLEGATMPNGVRNFYQIPHRRLRMVINFIVVPCRIAVFLCRVIWSSITTFHRTPRR